jgi:hypothetical protein
VTQILILSRVVEMASKTIDEYTTVGADAEDRKRHRKKRVEKNNAAEVVSNEDSQDHDTGNNRSGAQQVTESLFALDKRKHSGLQDVTAIRVSTNDSEAKRRIEDEDLRRSRCVLSNICRHSLPAGVLTIYLC